MTTLPPLYTKKEKIKIAKKTTKKTNKRNEGKLFEDDFKSSVPDTCWSYRFKDNAASFAKGSKTRFTSHNICDFEVFDDETRTLFLWELKSTQGTSIPFKMIRDTQVEELTDASKHLLIAGLVCNFRNENNDTFFINIKDFNVLKENINKKSFNISDLKQYNAVPIESHLKRTRHGYNVKKLIKETHLD